MSALRSASKSLKGTRFANGATGLTLTMALAITAPGTGVSPATPNWVTTDV
jgi:hypothetical protein